MKKYLSGLFLFATLMSFSQTEKIDSLLAVLQLENPDSTKIIILNTLGTLTMNSNQSQAISYFSQAENIFNSHPGLPTKLNAETKYRKANVYVLMGDYGKALEYSKSSFEKCKTNADYPLQIKNLNLIGRVYFYKGDYEKALEYYFRALREEEKLDDKKQIALSHSNLGNVYFAMGDPKKSLQYFQSSLSLFKDLNDKPGLQRSFNNTGLAYSSLNISDSAIAYFSKSEKMAKELNDKNGIAHAEENIAAEEMKRGNTSAALDQYMKSLVIREEIGDKMGISNTQLKAGKLLLEKYKKWKDPADLKKAETYFLSSLSIAKELSSMNALMDNYDALSKLAEAKGDYKSAYLNYKTYITYRDSIMNEENARKAMQVRMQFEYDRKEQEIELLKQENKLKELELEREKQEMKLEELKKENQEKSKKKKEK